MKRTFSKNHRIIERIFLYFAAFLIPAITVTIAFYAKGIAPFGGGFITGWDCYTQYVDYYDWLRRVLQGGASISYSFDKSLGGNVFGLFTYYLASPLNLLIVFFPEGTTLDFMTVLVIIKIGFCGLTCSIFLSKRFDLGTSVIIALACGYALCEYNAAFSVCGIMWVEGLILLPLVMLGIYRWVQKKQKMLFLASAMLSVICCWFTGYMIFLFSILYFLYEYRLCNGSVPVKRFLKDLIVFGIVMAVAVLLSFFILLPTAYAQMAGEDGTFSFVLWRAFYLADLPSALFIGRANISNAPQICCGTLALASIPLFFFNKKIGRSEKIAAAVFLVVMLLCTYLKILDEVWNGFRITRGYYCRFSFTICFLIIAIAGRSLERLEDRPRWSIPATAAILILAAIWAYIWGNDYLSITYFIVVLCAIAAVSAMLMLLRKHPALAGAALIVITAAEMGFNYYGTLNLLAGSRAPAARYASYRLQESSAFDQLKASDPSFFRMDKTYSRLDGTFKRMQPPTNEGLVLGYSQIEAYSSSTDSNVFRFLAKMGYSRGDDMGSSEYSEPILTTDSLLGVKYVGTAEGTIETNPYALPLGYAASNEILGGIPRYETEGLDWATTKSKSEARDPFKAQNRFISMLMGENVECFKPLDATQITDTDTCKQWSVDTQEKAKIYAYIDTDKLSYNTLTVGSRTVGEYGVWSKYFIFDISDLQSDGTIQTVPEIEGKTLGSETLIAYYLDMDVFNRVIDKLRSTGFYPDTVREDGYVHGTYSSNEDTLLFTTVPYDTGWTVFVNGEKVDYQKAAGAFIAIPVSAGDNEVTMQYTAPGLYAGATISLVTLLGLIGFETTRRKRRQARTADNESLE